MLALTKMTGGIICHQNFFKDSWFSSGAELVCYAEPH